MRAEQRNQVCVKKIIGVQGPRKSKCEKVLQRLHSGRSILLCEFKFSEPNIMNKNITLK